MRHKEINLIFLCILIIVVSALQNEDIHTSIYNGCGDYKQCFGYAENCVGEKNCLAMGTVYRKGKSFIFEMHSMQTFQYVAIGLSTDKVMKDDSVMECVREGDKVKLYSSFTEIVNGNYGSKRSGIPQDNARLLNAYVKDNKVYCRIERDAKSIVNGHIFDLSKSDFYMMVVSGTTTPENQLTYHVIKILSDNKVEFNKLKEEGDEDYSEISLFSEDYYGELEIISTTQKSINKIYSGCGLIKTCFGIPTGCVDSFDCVTFSSVSKIDNNHVFEMRSKMGAAYVAVGISRDTKMGNDLVIECVKDGNVVKVYSSLTTDGPPFECRRDDVPQNITQLKTGRIDNDIIYCLVEQKSKITLQNQQSFDLDDEKYFMMLATSDVVQKDSISKHTERAVSSELVNFNEFKNISQMPKTFINIHGSLMIVAWLGAAAIAGLLPRHYRKNWTKKSICDKDIWFSFHVILMYMALVFTILAAIIIFIDMEGLSMTENPHWILGIITTSLAVIQVVYAVMRPSPLSEYRKCFNTIHWIIGSVTQITATLAVYFSVGLEKSGLSRNSLLFFASFSVYYGMMLIGLFTLEFYQEKKGYRAPSELEFTEINRADGKKIRMSTRNKRFAKYRSILLKIFIVCTLIYLTIALWIIWTSN